MIITQHGLEYFKVQFGNTVVAFNPVSKESDSKTTKFGADIAISSLHHQNFNGFESVTHGNKEPFRVSGPGEYEVQEVFIKGLPTKTEYGGQEKINTIYTVELEGMHMCFLGVLNSADIPAKVKEEIDGVAGEVLDPASAYKLAVNFEPSVIVPMHFEEGGKEIKTFLKEGGQEGEKAIDKLTVKKKDLADKEASIVLLKQT